MVPWSLDSPGISARGRPIGVPARPLAGPLFRCPLLRGAGSFGSVGSFGSPGIPVRGRPIGVPARPLAGPLIAVFAPVPWGGGGSRCGAPPPPPPPHRLPFGFYLRASRWGAGQLYFLWRFRFPRRVRVARLQDEASVCGPGGSRFVFGRDRQGFRLRPGRVATTLVLWLVCCLLLSPLGLCGSGPV